MMIEVRGLTKLFGRNRAVDGISFDVAEGDVFGFIGPNGAGKTTTIRMLATLLNPTNGSARIDGHCVENFPARVRKVIGFMPDFFDVYKGITVWEYLDFFAAAYKIERRRRVKMVEAVMELTDLDGMRGKFVSALSKGMRQRLCLAKTLVHDPKVLILDEPASGLDPRARIEFRELLKELADMGKTIFISSHILTELSDICNCVGIIEHGLLVASGPVDEIKRSLQKGNRVILTIYEEQSGDDDGGSGYPETARAMRIAQHHPLVVSATSDANRITIDFSGNRDEIRHVVKALVDEHVPLIGLEEEEQNLEDLFMKLTKGELA